MKLLTATLVTLAALNSAEPAAAPRYNNAGELLSPEGYREWIFVGANLGMSYSDEPRRSQSYHNVYVQPESYRQYRDTGTFPEKTMFVMEVLSAGTKESINRQGSFSDKSLGFEVAVKDSSRAPKEKWSYYNFIGRDGKSLPSAKAFPAASCWACHHTSGAVDNVFVQFYPVLRDLRPIQEKPGH